MKLLYKKHMEPQGFNVSNPFHSAGWNHMYYKKIPTSYKVVVVDNLEQRVVVFNLGKRNYAKFEANKLALIPPGCCNPAGGAETDECDVLHEGEIKNMAQFKEILAKI